MISKTAEILGVEEKDVILLACNWLFKSTGGSICCDHLGVWDVYQKTGYVPSFVVDYCSMKEGENHE